MTTADIRICKTQGQFYQYMAKLKYDMDIFSDVFMKSDFCHRHFDTIYSPYQAEFPMAMYELCMPEMGSKLKKTDFLSENDRCFAEAAGFLYRKLYQETSIPSDKLAEIVPYKELISRFANDVDWFEAEHRGETGIFADIMREHDLQSKRYDAEVKKLLKGSYHVT